MVLGTIVENENLRQLKLMCHDAHFNPSHFGSLMNDENISLALSRLDSLKLSTTYCDFDPVFDWGVSLTKIIRALNDHALLKQTAKAIQLRFVLSHGFVEKKDAKNSTIATFNRALSRLSSLNIRPGLQMICVGSWTRIFFGNANLMCCVRLSKMSSKSVIKKFLTRFGFCEMNLT
uniref:Uncharacterized protein n=1 Tax=Plectus sambesii TaxID=2011161 RepID=A0A914UWV1_9BILA